MNHDIALYLIPIASPESPFFKTIKISVFLIQITVIFWKLKLSIRILKVCGKLKENDLSIVVVVYVELKLANRKPPCLLNQKFSTKQLRKIPEEVVSVIPPC